jgi:hypothetical protein
MAGNMYENGTELRIFKSVESAYPLRDLKSSSTCCEKSKSVSAFKFKRYNATKSNFVHKILAKFFMCSLIFRSVFAAVLTDK